MTNQKKKLSDFKVDKQATIEIEETTKPIKTKAISTTKEIKTTEPIIDIKTIEFNKDLATIQNQILSPNKLAKSRTAKTIYLSPNQLASIHKIMQISKNNFNQVINKFIDLGISVVLKGK